METPAITEYSTLASPLDHVFRHVPKAHEKALRQAVYNVIAAATLGGICFAAYYVQVVLEPFIMPMIWALLTGFVIHPYKTHLADSLRNQLRRFGESETPASLMLLSSLVTLIDESFDLIGKSILASWKLILLLVFGLVSSYYIVAVIAFEPLIEKFYYWITPATYMIDCFHSIQFSHLLLIFIGYMSAVYFLWTSNRALIFQVVSSMMWMLLIGFALNTNWAPFFCSFVAIAVYAKFWKFSGRTNKSSVDDSEVSTPDTDASDSPPANLKFRKAVFSILKSLQQSAPDNSKVQIQEEEDALFIKNKNSNVLENDQVKHDLISTDENQQKDDMIAPYSPSVSSTKDNENILEASQVHGENEPTQQKQPETFSDSKPMNEKMALTTKLNPDEVISSNCEEAKIVHPGVSALKKEHLGSKVSQTPVFPQNLSRLPNPSSVGLRTAVMSTPHLYTSTPGVRAPLSTGHGMRTTRFAERARTTIIRRKSSDIAEDGNEEVHESTFYLNWVAWCCLALQLWFHPILLELLPIPVLYCIVKWIFSKFDLLDPLHNWIQDSKSNVHDWVQERSDALAPRPVRSIWRELYKIEKKILRAAPVYTDVIVTILLIVACNIFVLCLIFYITFQLYSEGIVLMQLSSTVMSKITETSVYQQLNDTIVGKCAGSDVEVCSYVLPGNYTNRVDELIESAYKYGRKYISSSISSLMRDNSDNKQDVQLDHFENQVLQLWDRIYQYWINKNTQVDAHSQDHSLTSSEDSENIHGNTVTSDAITSSMEELFSGMLNASVPTRVFGNGLNYSVFSQFALNNIGTLTSVLDQGWALLKGNIGLVLTVVTECLRVLLSGGSGMVNFCLSLIVYFTALFYLLQSKNPIYKPIEVISNHGQLLGSGFATALEKAVNGVFTLTVKMVCFYGMWTYLTHKIFAVSLVTLPVLVAAFLAAVPVAGQYVVAVPAALELWLAESRWLAAILVMLAHVIPTYVVDGAIYSEARQDIHPWITGLSIIGGVYWCGVPGAIYGPLLLCAVYVILSMYTSLLKEIPLESNTLHKSAADKRKSRIGQSLLCGISERTGHQTPIMKRSDSVF